MKQMIFLSLGKINIPEFNFLFSLFDGAKFFSGQNSETRYIYSKKNNIYIGGYKPDG